MTRRRRRRLIGIVACFSAALIMAVAGLVALDGQLRPLVQSYGCMSARRSAMVAVHSGVERVLADENASYGQFVTVLRNEEGRVMSAETDVSAVNRLKAAVSTEVMRQLSTNEVQTVSIPLGSLIGGSFFTGRGPFLKLDVHTYGTVITTLSGEFTDAGINQVKHSLYLDLQVLMTAALPMERAAVELETRFLVCETVFVGEVPETVLQMDFGGAVDKFFGSSD